MEDNTEFKSECEKVQYFICLEGELDDDCRQHMEKCEKCRAFPQKYQKMHEELKNLRVPGINGGDISKRVMKEIQTSKVFSFPKVNYMRHAGTAAAILIVIALFANQKGYNFIDLANNAPDTSADKRQSQVLESKDTENTAVKSDIYFIQGNNENTVISEESKAQVQTYKDDTILYSVNSALDTPKVQSQNSSEALKRSYDYSSSEKQAVTDSFTPSSEEQIKTASQDISDVTDSSDAITESESVSGERGSAGSADSADAEDKAALSTAASDTALLFSSIAFDTSDIALTANISASNALALQLCSAASVIDEVMVSRNNITNGMFIEWVLSITDISQYSFESLIKYFEGVVIVTP